jgi:predicted dienelactone hydrolase
MRSLIWSRGACAAALVVACNLGCSSESAKPTNATEADSGIAQIAAPTGAPSTWAVGEKGPFNVGYRTLDVSYVTPNGETRTFDVNIWYPTLDDDGEHPKYNAIFYDNVSYTNASLARSPYADGKYPVQVYSHGDRGYPDNSVFLMRHFASHGWVSIAPRHVGNTLGDTPAQKPPSLYYLRGKDVSAAIDVLGKLPSGDPLTGKTDASRVFMTGHSFGGYTVWTVAGATFDVAGIESRCRANPSTPDAGTSMPPCTDADLAAFRAGVRDPRVIAGFPMAGMARPDWIGNEGHKAVTIPMFFMSGTDDPIGQQEFYDRLAPFPMTWVDVKDACHLFFSTGKCNLLADAKQVPVVGSFALAFARKTLLGDTTAEVADVLAGRKNDPSVITFKTR